MSRSAFSRVPSASQSRRTRIVRDAIARHANFPNRASFLAATSIVAIYTRDKGRCGICKRKCEFKDASIDHIRPLARGGKHAPENMQLAHLACNKRKGASWGPFGHH